MYIDSTLVAISELVRTLTQSGCPLTGEQRGALIRWAVERSVPTADLLAALREGAAHAPAGTGIRQPVRAVVPTAEFYSDLPANIATPVTAPSHQPHLAPQQSRQVAAHTPAPAQPSRPGLLQQAAIVAAGTAGGLMLRDGLYAAGNAAHEKLASLDQPDVVSTADFDNDGATDFAVIDSNENGIADMGDALAFGDGAQAAAEADSSLLDQLGEFFS